MRFFLMMEVHPMGEAEKHPQKAIPAAVQTMIDGMDASPYTGPAAGRFRKESPLDPDGIKVPRWKFIHGKDKEDSSCRLQLMDWIWQKGSCSCTG
jgi:hypothetical protein